MLRLLISAVAAAALVGPASAAESAANPTPAKHALKDPHYGDTLFHFYQDHYFSAVTSLMVSQHFDRVSHHGDEAELLRGGLLLSYGLHREAGEIFTRLIDQGTTPSVRDRAWFYLAKIRYQRSLMTEAADAADRINGHLPPELEEDRGLLIAHLLMARGDYAEAANFLDGMTMQTEAGIYTRYNLGIALIRSGDTTRGTAILDQIGRSPTPPVAFIAGAGASKSPAGPSTDEYRSLRDQANVALGFNALQNNEPAAARSYLERVRLTGMHANKALLGFGWAAAELKQPAQALVPWNELVQRDASDAAALEARIAVPYALAELKAYGPSLDGYNAAIAAFERERTWLDESITAIRAGKLVEGLMEINPGEEMGWFWNIRELPEMPHAGHLAPVLAQHEFQEAFKNYRDLHFLRKNLERWQDSLVVFGDMLANRRQAFAERLPEIRKRAGDIGLNALQDRETALATELAQVETEADGSAFADERQRELLERLQRVRDALEAAEPSPEIEAARKRYRLVAGALTWQLGQEFPARLWITQQAMQASQATLAEARQRDMALAQAQRDEPIRFDDFGARISALGPRLQVLMPRVAALSDEQRKALQEIAVAELDRQKERLTEYTIQARFAVAQLYDRASLQKEPDHARKP